MLNPENRPGPISLENQSLREAMHRLESLGYTKNFGLEFDHLSCDSGAIRLFPADFMIDHVFRFEVASDPDDNSILYAISSESAGVRGLYVESYGLYHEDMSRAMLERIKDCKLIHDVHSPG